MNEERSVFSRIWHHPAGRILLPAVLSFIIGFLVGFLPVWSNQRASETSLHSLRDHAQKLELQTFLGSAVVDASRGSYEAARQNASDFFTRFRAEAGAGPAFLFQDSAGANALFAQRDDIITLLARSDPSAVPRLAELYASYRTLVKPQEQQTTMLR